MAELLLRSGADISAEWLTDALRAHGTLEPDQSVEALESVTFGDQAGLLGELFRLTPTYSEGASGPASLVVKFPATDPAQRGIADTLGFYNRECLFYSDIADQAPYNTPSTYGVFQDGGDTTDFVLLMEDVAGLSQIDQVAGASVDEVRASVTAIAKQHAMFWNSDQLASLGETFLPLSAPVYHAALPQIFAAGWGNAKEAGGSALTPEVVAFGDRYGDLVPFLLGEVAKSPTLVHGDFRGDNIMFDTDFNPTLIDFQIVGIANGLYDVAYFMAQSVDSEMRKSIEGDMLKLYVDTLAESGVDLPLEEAERSYRIVLAFCFIYGVASFQSFEVFDGRQQELMIAMLTRSANAIVENNSLELLP